MTTFLRSRWPRLLATLFVVLAFIAACSSDNAPPAGLQLLLATDLATPEVLDSLTLEIRQEDSPGVWGQPLIKREFFVPAETKLPTTFAVAAGDTTRRRVRLVVVGKKSGTPLVLREVEIQVPEGRVAGLPLVLAEKCVGKVTPPDANGDVKSTCPNPAESCQPDTGQCGPTEQDPASLRNYSLGDEDALPSGEGAPIPAAKSDKDITAFVINGVDGKIQGSDIAVTLPETTDVKALAPTIAITGTSVTPASRAPRDFTNPVRYEVSARDGTTKAYTARVILAKFADPAGFNPLGGTYASAQNVVLATPTPNAKIYFTTDGTVPVPPAGYLYATPIPVTKTTTINAVVAAPGMLDSDVATATYTINIPPGTTAPVSFAPPPGQYGNPAQVGFDTSTVGATICFTQDGSAPTCDAATATCNGSSARYLGTKVPIDAAAGATIVTMRAIACKVGNNNSDTTQAAYSWRAFAPTSNPAPGNIAAGTVATLETLTADAGGNNVFLYYTTGGPAPDCGGVGTRVNGRSFMTPAINADTTYQVVACRPHYDPSNVSVFTFNVPPF